MRKFYALSLVKSVVILPLLVLLIGLSPLSIQANVQDLRVEEPQIDGHLFYFSIPLDISREKFLFLSEPLKARLHNLVKEHLSVQNGSLQTEGDLVVVFTDHDGQPILPDLEATRSRLSEVGGLSLGAATANELTFSFDSPEYPWSAEDLTKLETIINDFYPTAKIVYGNPAFNITVNVRQDPTISYSGLYNASLNEMVVKNTSDPSVIFHEMIHAFRDDDIIGLTSCEEGMTRAAEVEIFDRLAAYTSWDENHSYYYDVYYESLNSPVIGSQYGGFFNTYPNTLLLLRYQLAGYAWAKPLLENSNFLGDFNRELYARVLSDPDTRLTESKLLEIAVKVQPTVEGKPFLTWYEQQGVLNTNPPKGYFLHHRPSFTVDFFYRDTTGTETMQPNATINWAVYDYKDTLLDSGSGVTTTYGWTEFNPILPGDYEGRIKVEATASTPDGLISHTWYLVNFGSQLQWGGIFGVTPYANSGTITIASLDDSEAPVSVNLINGAFSVPSLLGGKGRFIVEFKDTNGRIFSKQFNKDASDYFLLMVTSTETISPPVIPSGPTSGTTGTSYTYTTEGSPSNLGHSVQYFFDWGDGTNSGWLPVGQPSATKFWSSTGTFLLKAKARCSIHTSIESNWSDPLTVTISNVGPDLTGSWTSPIIQSCKNTKTGVKCSIKGGTLTVRNTGNRNAQSTYVDFYLANDNALDGSETPLKRFSTGSIKTERSKALKLNYNFPIGQTASGKYVIAVIDPDNLVTETDETNNTIVYGPIQ